MSTEATTKPDGNDTAENNTKKKAASLPARPQSHSELEKERADWEGMAQPLPEREEDTPPKP